MTTSDPGGLTAKLAAVLDDIAAPDGLREELDAVRDRLLEPLRVVVAGRVSSGKSTIVNALLGQRVAPTDVGECTAVATWFRYGYPQHVRIRLRDGSVHETGLEHDGGLPRQLGYPLEQVAQVEAWLTNETLRAFTLVDTPGFSSATSGQPDDPDSGGPTDVRTRAAAEECDAMVFVLNQSMRADELDMLRAFQRSQPGPASAVNAIGVLTKADKLGDGSDDPWGLAVAVAKRAAQRHDDTVSDVLPLIGILAESSECASIGDRDVQQLQALAAMDDAELRRMLVTADRFTTQDCPVPRDARTRLLELLDLYGVAQAIDMVRDGATTSGRLRTRLSAACGITDLRTMLLEIFAGRATSLRLLWASDVLVRLSYAPGLDRGEGRRLRDAVEATRLHPDMHVVRELEAMQAVCVGGVTLPLELTDDVRRLALNRDPQLRLGIDDGTPEALRAAARDAVARWRNFRSHASPAQDQVARVVVKSWQLAYAAASSAAPSQAELAQ